MTDNGQHGGFIRLWRKAEKSAVFQHDGVWRLFCLLLFRVKWKPDQVVLNIGKEACVVHLEAGQYALRLRLVANDLRISVGTLRRRLAILERIGCIHQQPTPKYVLITVLNWHEYQTGTVDGVSTSDTPYPDGVSNFDTPSDTPSDTHHKKKRKTRKQESNTSRKTATRRRGYTDDDMAVAEWMVPLVADACPGMRQPNLSKWADTIRLMRERDGRTHDEIRAMFSWANSDSFWRANVLSPDKLRQKWDTLTAHRLRGNHQQRTKQVQSAIHTGDNSRW